MNYQKIRIMFQQHDNIKKHVAKAVNEVRAK